MHTFCKPHVNSVTRLDANEALCDHTYTCINILFSCASLVVFPLQYRMYSHTDTVAYSPAQPTFLTSCCHLHPCLRKYRLYIYCMVVNASYDTDLFMFLQNLFRKLSSQKTSDGGKLPRPLPLRQSPLLGCCAQNGQLSLQLIPTRLPLYSCKVVTAHTHCSHHLGLLTP